MGESVWVEQPTLDASGSAGRVGTWYVSRAVMSQQKRALKLWELQSKMGRSTQTSVGQRATAINGKWTGARTQTVHEWGQTFQLRAHELLS